ncbi:hypothetical protein [Actinomyces ruminis]|uniref:hypothetical protein n=1 Tax=Actinomyces ruminis TaxID=1937003 RepID=UPI0015D4FB00|nr:hypothetical protein [Actinomyces ruminis]
MSTAPPPDADRLVVVVVSPTSLGTQAAHEVTPAVRTLADVVRVRTLAELFRWASAGQTSPPPADADSAPGTPNSSEFAAPVGGPAPVA